MTAKELLLHEATSAVRAAFAYEKVTSYFVKRSEIIAAMLDLPAEQIANATFLREHISIPDA